MFCKIWPTWISKKRKIMYLQRRDDGVHFLRTLLLSKGHLIFVSFRSWCHLKIVCGFINLPLLLWPNTLLDHGYFSIGNLTGTDGQIGNKRSWAGPYSFLRSMGRRPDPDGLTLGNDWFQGNGRGVRSTYKSHWNTHFLRKWDSESCRASRHPAPSTTSQTFHFWTLL